MRPPIVVAVHFNSTAFMYVYGGRNQLCCSETWDSVGGKNAANEEKKTRIKLNFYVENVKCIASECFRFGWSNTCTGETETNSELCFPLAPHRNDFSFFSHFPFFIDIIFKDFVWFLPCMRADAVTCVYMLLCSACICVCDHFTRRNGIQTA